MALPAIFSSPIAGALTGGLFSAFGARKQQKASQAMAREQMAFQERMSGTAFQRAAKDLEAAGLNRVLALGSPASSPGGAMGQAQNIAGAGVSSAQQSAMATANVKTQQEQARKVGYEADIMMPKAKLARAAGEQTGDLVDFAEKEIVPTIRSTAKDAWQKAGSLWDQWGTMYDDLKSWRAKPMPQTSGAKPNPADVAQANAAAAAAKRDLKRQIAHDEKALKMYKNEDVDTRQIKKRLANARFQLKLMEDPK